MKLVPIKSLSIHPQAGIVPEMSADEYAAFAADVAARGVLVAIEVVPGTNTVIDGRTRLRAAGDAGLNVVPVIEADLQGEPETVYILRAALSRRHLTKSQGAMLACEIESELAKSAKERQRQNAKATTAERQGRRATKVESLPPSLPSVERPKPEPKSREKAAATVGASGRTVQDAKLIKATSPELAKKVADGELTIHQAKQEVRRGEKRADLEAKAEAVKDTPANWRIVVGDCVEELGKVADRPRLIFADPPYNIGVNYGDGKDADLLSPDEYAGWVESWVRQSERIIADDGSFWLLISDEFAAEACVIVKRYFTLRNWITWFETFGVNCSNRFNRTKRHLLYAVANPKQFVFHADAVSRPSARQVVYNDGRASQAGKLWDDVWAIPRLTGTASERLPDFPTQLPLELLRPIVACCSEPNDLILDPFNGSGTTGVAAIETGRRYLGIEKNPRFAELATLRLKGAM